MRKIIFLLLSFLAVQITNAQINPQWVTKYSANGDYSAKYTCITKDKSDNIYAAGKSSCPQSVTIGVHLYYQIVSVIANVYSISGSIYIIRFIFCNACVLGRIISVS